MNDVTESKPGFLQLFVLGALAICAVAAVIVGGIAYGMGVDQWIDDGYSFSGWGMLVWAIGLVGAGIIMAGLIVIGIILRFLRWDRAPQASLALAVVSTGFILVTHSIFTSLDGELAEIEYFIVQVLAFLSLFAMPLPPFLHWLRADRKVHAPADLSGGQS